MKDATFPALRVDPELRQAAEDCLLEGESISDFVEQSIRENIERRAKRRAFIDQALTSRDQAASNGGYQSADAVFQRLQLRVEEAKAKASK